MEVIDYDLTYTHTNSETKLYLLGDIHAGTIHCLENKVRDKVQEIKSTKNAIWIGMGDYGEFITPSDPRFDPSQKVTTSWLEQDDIADCQCNWIVDLFKPIAHKCVGLLYGNHEEAIRIHSHTNVHKHICERLKVPNLGYSCFVRFRFKRDKSSESHIIKGCFTHGSGAAITKGAKVNRLRRFMNDFNARIYGYAHVHDIDQQRMPYITLSPSGKIIDDEAVGVLTGSWFSTYTQGTACSYGEKKAYPPTVIGCPVLILDPDKDKIQAIT